MELLEAAFSYSNFLITILFMMVLIYWMIVIIGAIKIDSFDFHLQHDVQVELPHGADAGNHLHHDIPSGSSWFFGMLQFFNFGRVPLMVVLSILILSMWTISMACNHNGSFLNPYNSFLISLIYVIPNVVISAFVMKFISTPLIPLFAKLDTHETTLHYEGYTGKLTTDIHENGTGQAKLLINNSNIAITVKVKEGIALQKGDPIIILGESPDKKYYIIEKSNEPLLD